MFTKIDIISQSVKSLILVISVFFPTMLIASMTLGYNKYRKIYFLMYNMSAFWLAVIMYTFAISIVSAGLYLTDVFVYKIPYKEITYILLILEVILVKYGIYHASKTKIKNVEIKNESLYEKWKDKKIVLISDLHIGPTRKLRFLKKVVRIINDTNPDIVFIAGDVIDGPVFDYENILQPLQEIKSTYGVYYTPGNHEYYNAEPEKYFPIIKNLTNTLIDEKTIVNDTQIAGFDFSEKNEHHAEEQIQKMNLDTTISSIALLHDPKHAKFLMEKGISLVLSGHTHKGQFFPVTWLVRSMYKSYTYGINYFGGNTSIVTSGVGTALVPMRIGTDSEILVIKINKD